MLNIIIQLVIAEFKDFYRNPGILFWAIGFPLIIATTLGFAFSKKPESIRKIGLISPGNSERNERLTKLDTSRHGVKFVFLPLKQEEAALSMKRGIISLYIESDQEELKYHFDPSNNESYLSYLIIENSLKSGTDVNNPDNIIPATTKGDRYIDFLIPGLLALGIMNSCLWGTAWVLTDMRIKKLMRRIISTPLPKSIFLFSHFIVRIVLSGFEFFVLSVFSYFAFGVEVSGSMTALFALFVFGNICFWGIAILGSSRATNTQIANGIINAVSFPMTLLSGIFFSYHNFPDWIVKAISFLPLTLLSDSIRAVFIEGADFASVLTSLILLSIYGVITFLFGLKIYKWE